MNCVFCSKESDECSGGFNIKGKFICYDDINDLCSLYCMQRKY